MDVIDRDLRHVVEIRTFFSPLFDLFVQVDVQKFRYSSFSMRPIFVTIWVYNTLELGIYEIKFSCE